METSKKVRIGGKEIVVLEPRIAGLILELNKKLAEAIDINKKIMKLVGENKEVKTMNKKGWKEFCKREDEIWFEQGLIEEGMESQ